MRMVIEMYVQRNDQLENAIFAINENIDPDKIYLFGSFAMGKSDEQSDLDLCIITNNLKGRKLDTLRKIRHSLIDRVSMPIDLLLYTTEEFGERAKLSSTLEYQIAKEGVLVHGS
jgi:predicted nucleotidyltransferase